METSLIVNTLFLAAAVVLVILSGGILYLTAIEWRDRRRQANDKKLNK